MNPRLPPALAAVWALAQEPWCFPPRELADVTVWQAENVYVRPAVERAEALGRGADGKARPAPMPAADPFEHGLPPRDAFVAAHLKTDGRDAAHWNAMYDRLERGE